MACCAVYSRTKLDSAQTTRKAFSCTEEAHRVVVSNVLIDKRNTRIELTYRAAPNCDCVCTVKYFGDRVAEINTIIPTADTCSSLNSKHFTLFSAKDAIQYYVWYDVSCAGVDPCVACATGIQVSITTNDAAPVVALATSQQIDLVCGFCATVCGSTVTVTNSTIGFSTATANGSGLCAFTYDNPTSGKNALQYTLCLVYDTCDRLITIDRE